jgi:leucyl aminopeptidase
MLLPLLLLALQSGGSGGEFAVWPYGSDLALRDRLIARGRMYDDLGGYLVGAPDGRIATSAGLEPIVLENLTTEEELFVVIAHAHAEHEEGGLENAGRLLWTCPDASVQLRAAPKSVLSALQGSPSRCHGAGRMVNASRPITPARNPAARGNGRQSAVSPDPDIQAWVAQVSQSNLLADVNTMVAFGTRRHGQPGEVNCENWLEAEFAALGLAVSTFNYDSGADNVIGELPGLKDPSKIVIIGGHYDSINYSTVAGAAPGADDDASGVAGVLEVARILSQQQFDYTIRFVGWSGEEQGLLGSQAYAAHLDQINADVVGMVQLDMIAYRNPNDTASVDFVTNSTDPILTAYAMAIYEAYVPGFPVESGRLLAGTSDHLAFFSHGFPACFPFEDVFRWSPYIHTSNDVVGVSANDFQLAEWMTEGALATIAELARPVSLTLSHVALPDTQDPAGPYVADALVLPLGGASTAGVELNWRVDGGAWNAVALTPGVAANSWTGDIPGQFAPARVDYYLVATASNGRQAWSPEGFEPGTLVHSFMVGSFQSIYANGFEGATDEGWTHAQVSTLDDWQRGAPKGKADDPLTAAAGAKVWGTDIGGTGFNGRYDSLIHNYLRSPVIDCSGRSGVHLRFQRWLSVEEGLHDHASIEVNGAVVWQNPADDHLVDAAWTEVDLDISQWADNNPAVQVTFRLESDHGLEFSGWNIDEFELYVLGTSGAGTNTISMSGPASVLSGGQAIFNFSGAQANAAFWLLNGANSNGTVFQGHSFDVGGSLLVLASGQADGAGAGSITLNVPAGIAGFTGRLEIAAVAGGAWRDSNLLVVSVQ